MLVYLFKKITKSPPAAVLRMDSRADGRCFGGLLRWLRRGEMMVVLISLAEKVVGIAQIGHRFRGGVKQNGVKIFHWGKRLNCLFL